MNPQAPQTHDDAATPLDGSNLSTSISKMAGIIGSAHYANADRAALKRWALGQPIPLAFYRLWLRHIGADLPPEGQIEDWMTLAWGMALCGGCHEARRPFGQALAESHFAEGRLERLLSAPDDLRRELFMSTVRFLAAKDACFDWIEAARYLLTRSTDKREAMHRHIAKNYYKHLTVKEKE